MLSAARLLKYIKYILTLLILHSLIITCLVTDKYLCVISVFRREVDEISALLWAQFSKQLCYCCNVTDVCL